VNDEIITFNNREIKNPAEMVKVKLTKYHAMKTLGEWRYSSTHS
jgi:hypothetical protein